jgi:hypothetical protein
MNRVPWKAGPEATGGAVFVSVTDFHVARYRDLPAVWLAGLRLRQAWPHLPGAIGLWLWAQPMRRRGGAVSVWRSSDDLGAFLRWPPHVEVIRRFGSAGRLESHSWQAPRFDRDEVWAWARATLAADRT